MNLGEHPIYSRPAAVYLVTGNTKLEALDEALERAGFVEQLEEHHRASGKQRDEFAIAIKPNIMTASVAEDDSPVYTDPVLVERLIQRIRGRGFRNIAVVEARNVYDYSYRGRSVEAVAEMVGYTSNGYRIVNLTEEKVPFDYGGALGAHVVGETWRDADYRISFAKNKTHWQCFYTACIKNVYGCLPEWDKMHHYHGSGVEFYQAAVLMADHFPVHFGLLDAWVSGDGFSGHVRDAHPNETRTIVASRNIFALDWVAGEKMRLEPAQNFVMQEALNRWGVIEIDRRGDMTPWYPWVNVGRLPVVAFAWIEEWYQVSRFLSRAMAAHQDPRFPPVSRAQRLFGVFQSLTRFGERLFTKKQKAPKGSPPPPRLVPMRKHPIGVIEAFYGDLVTWVGRAMLLLTIAGVIWREAFGMAGLWGSAALGLIAATGVVLMIGGASVRRNRLWLNVGVGLWVLAVLSSAIGGVSPFRPVPASIALALLLVLGGVLAIRRRIRTRFTFGTGESSREN